MNMLPSSSISYYLARYVITYNGMTEQEREEKKRERNRRQQKGRSRYRGLGIREKASSARNCSCVFIRGICLMRSEERRRNEIR
jgi:hypothetical protein